MCHLPMLILLIRPTSTRVLIKPFHAVFKELIKHFQRLAYSKKKNKKSDEISADLKCLNVDEEPTPIASQKKKKWELGSEYVNKSNISGLQWFQEQLADDEWLWYQCSYSFMNMWSQFPDICGKCLIYIRHPESLLLKFSVNLLGLPFTKDFSSRLVVVLHLKQLVD